MSNVSLGKFSLKPGWLSATHFSQVSCWAFSLGMRISFLSLPCSNFQVLSKIQGWTSNAVVSVAALSVAALCAGSTCLNHDAASVPGGDCSATELRCQEWAQMLLSGRRQCQGRERRPGGGLWQLQRQREFAFSLAPPDHSPWEYWIKL